jgi:hypothetical protein
MCSQSYHNQETLDLIEQELLRMDNMLKEIVAALKDRYFPLYTSIAFL